MTIAIPVWLVVMYGLIDVLFMASYIAEVVARRRLRRTKKLYLERETLAVMERHAGRNLSCASLALFTADEAVTDSTKAGTLEYSGAGFDVSAHLDSSECEAGIARHIEQSAGRVKGGAS